MPLASTGTSIIRSFLLQRECNRTGIKGGGLGGHWEQTTKLDPNQHPAWLQLKNHRYNLKNSLFIGSRSTSESEAKCDNCQVLLRQLGASLNCRIHIEVALPVCRFIVNFWGYNFLSREFLSCCYCPVHQTLQAWSKPTGEKVVLVHPAVYRWSRSPFATLIVGKPVLFNYSSVVIYYILRHDIHWCQKYTWDSINLAQRKNQPITMENIFSINFLIKIGFLTAPLWFPKERASFMLVVLLLSSNSSSGHAETFSKIFSILVQFGCRLKRTSRVFVGQTLNLANLDFGNA